MKKIVILITFLFIKFCLGQTIEYSYRNMDANLKYELLLDYNSDTSEWKVIQNAKGEKIINQINNLFVKNNRDYYLYDKTLSKKFLVHDSIDLAWIKTLDTKEVLGYMCNSATTTFRGRKYKAYYTTEINFDNGPWKFSGLGGLILLVESEDKNYVFTATNIDLKTNKLNKDIVSNFINKNTFAEWNDYVTIYKNEVNAFIKNEYCNCHEDGKNILKITKIEKIYPELHDTGIVY